MIQVGLGGEIALPQNMVVAKEIEMRGSFRFHEEFALAVDLINRRRVDLKPLLTDVLPLSEAVKAFELASDRSRAMKIQIAL
jgi:L-idonate 5-dehydrogenase